MFGLTHIKNGYFYSLSKSISKLYVDSVFLSHHQKKPHLEVKKRDAEMEDAEEIIVTTSSRNFSKWSDAVIGPAMADVEVR